MDIIGLASLSLPPWLQRLETSVISSLGTSTPFSAGSAGDAQSGSASSATSTAAATAPSTPSTQFAPDLLSALLSAQNAPPSAASVANGLISQLDSSGDGSLSLAEVMRAVTGQDSTGTDSAQAPGSTTVSAQAVASNAVVSAFAKLDANGDGQLSSSELAAAITTLNQQASSVFGRHRHHPHADEPLQASESTPTSGSTTSSTSAPSTTTASASGAASTAGAGASAA